MVTHVVRPPGRRSPSRALRTLGPTCDHVLLCRLPCRLLCRLRWCPALRLSQAASQTTYGRWSFDGVNVTVPFRADQVCLSPAPSTIGRGNFPTIINSLGVSFIFLWFWPLIYVRTSLPPLLGCGVPWRARPRGTRHYHPLSTSTPLKCRNRKSADC